MGQFSGSAANQRTNKNFDKQAESVSWIVAHKFRVVRENEAARAADAAAWVMRAVVAPRR